MLRASESVRSRSFSVSMDAQAIDVVQPRQRNRTSAIRSPATRAASLRMSPQTGLLTSTAAVAPGSSPALRGLRKCSSTASLNIFESMAKAVPRLQRAKNEIHAVQDKHSCLSREEAHFFRGKYFFSIEAITT